MSLISRIVIAAVFTTEFASAASALKIRLPERTRVLTRQQFDLRIEATQISSLNVALDLKIDGQQIGGSAEIVADQDDDPATLDKAWTFRNMSFSKAGVHVIEATVADGLVGTLHASARVGVQDFQIKGKSQSVILFIGDAMGTAYRDAGRLVQKSAGGHFREGFFDSLQEMDSMPVTGMVMTYALDRVVPDSANTATAWSTGNKTVDGALGTFPDNNDFRISGSSQTTKQWALDNPRVETLWEYLKRLYGYKTGIVSTADITDATPAGEGGHTITRSLLNDIAKQYTDGVFTAGPTFDVIMGGGKEHFDARTISNSGDTRNLAAELQSAGYTYVLNRTELNALPTGSSAPNKLLGLFRRGNMDVAYDKLGLDRMTASTNEPSPNFGGFIDQPFLDEMTQKAIETLSKGGGPFILMVEGASIDKQSHPNHAYGTLWDTIEFDKAVGVGRRFAAEVKSKDAPLILVSADHDQSMVIVGVADTNANPASVNTRSNSAYPKTATPPPSAAGGSNPGEVGGFPDYSDQNGDLYPENANRFKLAVAFRTGNHTGSSVPITAEGPGALLFVGYFDQTDIFFKTARAISSETAPLDNLLKQKDKLAIIDQNY